MVQNGPWSYNPNVEPNFRHILDVQLLCMNWYQLRQGWSNAAYPVLDWRVRALDLLGVITSEVSSDEPDGFVDLRAQ